MTDAPDNFIEWFFLNEEEYSALIDAEDGNPEPLSEIINGRGYLRTVEAREYVSSVLLGKPKRRGAKRTVSQQAKEVFILWEIFAIQRELDCGEHKARLVFLERRPDVCTNEDTLKTYVRRAKETLTKAFGRPPSVGSKKADF